MEPLTEWKILRRNDFLEVKIWLELEDINWKAKIDRPMYDVTDVRKVWTGKESLATNEVKWWWKVGIYPELVGHQVIYMALWNVFDTF